MARIMMATLCAVSHAALLHTGRPSRAHAAQCATRLRMAVAEDDSKSTFAEYLAKPESAEVTFAEYLANRESTPSKVADDDATRDSSPAASYLESTIRSKAPSEGVQKDMSSMDGRVVPTQSGGAQRSVATPDLTTRAVRILGPLALAAGAVAGTLAVTSATAPRPITMDEIVASQRTWGNAIVSISNTYLAGGDYVGAASKAADELYGYGRTDVLFKPTKAAKDPFRPTPEGALSYFVGGDKIAGGYPEDHGFALGPDGMGWKKVIFDNSKVDFNGATATAMGEYYFYSAADDSVAKVEYTFGYKRNDDGKIRIFLHHSSLPYPGAKKA